MDFQVFEFFLASGKLQCMLDFSRFSEIFMQFFGTFREHSTIFGHLLKIDGFLEDFRYFFLIFMEVFRGFSPHYCTFSRLLVTISEVFGLIHDFWVFCDSHFFETFWDFHIFFF